MHRCNNRTVFIDIPIYHAAEYWNVYIVIFFYVITLLTNEIGINNLRKKIFRYMVTEYVADEQIKSLWFF